MPVLKVKKNGVWEELGGTSPLEGGNADTLGGKTATYFENAIAAKASSSHTHSAYVNQNAFSNVKVGTTTIAADSATDTLTLVAGNNVTLTPSASSDQITISATNTTYTHPNSGVTAGTYKSVTVNSQGHVTGGTNPTTLSGYGITDGATKTELNSLSSSIPDLIDDAIGEHTHNYAGSSSAGGAANSVKTKLTLKLNGGTTEGTNLFTYNGSSAKTVNITPSSIGAAATSHGTHVTFGTGSPKTAGTASAGSATTVSRSDHVHPAQVNITGNAATATKATQDGSGNTITSTYVTKTTFNSTVQSINDTISNMSSGKSLSEHLTEEDLVLIEGKHYGYSLPPTGTKGQLFVLITAG